jgi:hypothetical protein
MRRLFALALGVALVGGASCLLTKLDGDACSQDSDCGSSGTCLFDLSRSESLCVRTCPMSDTGCAARCKTAVNSITAYCTKSCAADSDCPATEFCDVGTDVATSSAAVTRLCLKLPRACSSTELCNGLDDDCNGIVDDNCKSIDGCQDDQPCGQFVCQVPEDQMLPMPTSICAAPNPNASVADYMPCTDGSQCRNNLCETGYCAPLCRGRNNVCDPAFFCARAVSALAVAQHDVCQKPCVSTPDCTVPGQHCVWRDVYNEEPNHAYVCSSVDKSRRPIGARCDANTPIGDNECQDGLCFGRPPVCTRPCASQGEDCSDVGAGYTCHQMVMLEYQDEMFVVPICVGPNG